MKNFGIVVSGGPAPGINSVIHSAVIELYHHGYRAWGIRNGFKDISTLGSSALLKLDVERVSRIARFGGSILGTSRFNPFLREDHTRRFVETIRQYQIEDLIVIGGEGSAFLSSQMHQHGIRVIHVPKTIDNDLPLPHNHPSFGFETAREVGSQIVDTLMTDAKTCGRWYLAVTMGRQAGFLALGLGIASGATLTLIPEEFSDRLYGIEEIAEIVYSSIRKRYASRRRHGVALLAEGLLDRLDPNKSSDIASCAKDELGRITYSELELSELLIPILQEYCVRDGIEVTIKSKKIGYELRCADPNPFDIEYTKFLGISAAQLLMQGHTHAMVIRDLYNMSSISLSELCTEKGMQARTVDLQSDFYRVARSLMIRDEPL